MGLAVYSNIHEVHESPRHGINPVSYTHLDVYKRQPLDMAAFYKTLYPAFNEKRFRKFLVKFTLQKDRKIQTFSKGMKKQLSILLGVCSGVKYLFCDETFDGLDPVMRQGIKSILANEIDERKFTPIIASHNLRELEDICCLLYTSRCV